MSQPLTVLQHVEQAHPRAAIYQEVHHLLRLAYGNGKADTQTGFGGAENGKVNADDVAAQVHQRPTAVAGVDGGIGLNDLAPLIAYLAGAFGADNTGSNCILEIKGIAHSDNFLPYLHLGRVAQRQGCELSGGINWLYHRNIVGGIGAQFLGLELIAVHGLDDQPLCPADNVGVG